jgi:ribose transport system ATP-binding protein
MGLAVKSLTKAYAGVTVLDDVDLTVDDGEIHALLGANGAGKSTLIKCISGAITPDAGEIEVSGQTFNGLTPREAWRAGVAVIYQELSVATTLNVNDNVFLGSELRRGPLLRRRAERAETREWLGRLGLKLDPDASLSGVGNAELQVIEIVKALHRDPGVLILDEPTAALTETEAQQLGKHMQTLRGHGLPLLFVTHRLAEVFEWADRVTVLRGGQVVLSGKVAELSKDELVTAIVGRAIEATGDDSDLTGLDREPVLRVSNLVGPGIGPIDLEARPGEVLGIFGLVGSGRTELLESLFGARKLHGGTIECEGEALRLRRPDDAVAAGLALVPSDRLRKSVFPTLPAGDNVLLPRMSPLSRFGFRSRARERVAFDGVTAQLNLDPPRRELEARRFSGGNQQKLVISRWLQSGSDCRVLLLDEPTQGVDVGARKDLYDALLAFAKPDRAVLLTSSEPGELLQLASRVLVLSRGRAVGLLRGADITERRMLELAHLGE